MSLFKETVLEFANKYLKDVDGRKGWYFTTITSQVVRVLISIAVGALVIPFSLFDWVTGINFMPFWGWLLTGLSLAVYIGWNETKTNIPVNHVGIVTFLGRRYPIYLKEGTYWWLGRRFFINITNQPLPGAKNVQAGDGEEQGRVFIGNRVLQIWNDREGKKINISLPARAGSTVTVNLTVTLQTFDPILWALADDPILQVAEQARAGLRKSLTFFRDTDVSSAKSAVTALIEGKTVLAVFLPKNAGSHLTGSMVQNKSGIPMYKVVEENDKPNLVAIAKAFGEHVMKHGDKDMVDAAMQDGGVIVATLVIQEHLNKVLPDVGAALNKIILSDAQLSQVVREASERAAAEGAQRRAQMTSAQTQADVIEVLAKAREGIETDDLDRLIAAAQDGNEGVQIIHVTGSPSDLVKAAVAGGQQVKGRK